MATLSLQGGSTRFGDLGVRVDVAVGVSMAAEAVRVVLVEGEGGGGVTVNQDAFNLAGDGTAVAAADFVIAAILGTRESATKSGYHLKSSGVAWTDPARAIALRDALAARKIQDVVVVSAVAAAALAQAAGSATDCGRTALLLVEPTTATLAFVDSAHGSVTDVHRHHYRAATMRRQQNWPRWSRVPTR